MPRTGEQTGMLWVAGSTTIAGAPRKYPHSCLPLLRSAPSHSARGSRSLSGTALCDLDSKNLGLPDLRLTAPHSMSATEPYCAR